MIITIIFYPFIVTPTSNLIQENSRVNYSVLTTVCSRHRGSPTDRGALRVPGAHVGVWESHVGRGHRETLSPAKAASAPGGKPSTCLTSHAQQAGAQGGLPGPSFTQNSSTQPRKAGVRVSPALTKGNGKLELLSRFFTCSQPASN